MREVEREPWILPHYIERVRHLRDVGDHKFAAQGDDNPRVIEAMGLATLRMPLLPSEAPPDRREMILMAGRASYMMATRNTAAAETAFQALAARYPERPNVHYAYGVFLLAEKPDKALEEFKKELEIQPGHPSALMQIAYEYLNRGDAKTALPWAQQAVAAAPKEFAAHKALGQALIDAGDIEGAIKELLVGIELAPESPGLHFQLARAYQRAGRMEDAQRERDEFTRLDRLANYNEKLYEFVTNRNDVDRIIEFKGELFQKENPVYLDPESRFVKAHFYAPRKMLFGCYISTLWMNIIVIWIGTLLLYALLYFRVLKRLFDGIVQLADKFPKSVE